MTWDWFVEKVLPSLFLTVSIAVGTAAFSIWKTVSDLGAQLNAVDHRLKIVESKVEQTVTRAELLETLKRVEQQLQIVLLQSGVKQKIELK